METSNDALAGAHEQQAADGQGGTGELREQLGLRQHIVDGAEAPGDRVIVLTIRRDRAVGDVETRRSSSKSSRRTPPTSSQSGVRLNASSAKNERAFTSAVTSWRVAKFAGVSARNSPAPAQTDRPTPAEPKRRTVKKSVSPIFDAGREAVAMAADIAVKGDVHALIPILMIVRDQRGAAVDQAGGRR